MASLYADENFHFQVVAELRRMGHDVLTAYEAGKAGQRISDPDVLAHSISLGRTILTHNRKHFIRLHKLTPNHCGIVVCTYDVDFAALALRIDQALVTSLPLVKKLIRVNKPVTP